MVEEGDLMAGGGEIINTPLKFFGRVTELL